MSPQKKVLTVLVLTFLFGSSAAVRGDQPKDEAAIRKSVESYAAAYNTQDAKLLAAHWLPDAVYIDPDTGAEVVGSAAIEKHFATLFAKAKNVKLVVNVESIRFVSPHVAVEQGTASVLGPDKNPEKTSYKAIHVLRDGKWLLDRVSEQDEPVVLSNYEKLKELEWLVGNWVDDDDEANVETTCKWSKNQNFLIRTYSISVGDRIKDSGLQIIGWDPTTKRIRSWIFDSDGGFGEGVWSKKGKRWYVQANETLANGKKASSTDIITVINKDSFTWQATNRQADGVLLPNVHEVLLIRKPDAR
jgi:uncharacterized protein (TIGR02246 family)